MNASHSPTEEQVRETLKAIPATKDGQNALDAEMIRTLVVEPPTVKLSFLYDRASANERVAYEAIVTWELKKLDGIDDVLVYWINTQEQGKGEDKPIGQKPQAEPQQAGQPVGRKKPGVAPQVSIPGVKHIIAVASGKGGVGKSTVAANLSAALVQEGQRVGLLDADIYGPSVPIMFDITGQLYRTPHGKIRPLEKDSLKLMSMGFAVDEQTPVIWRGLMVMKMIKQFLLTVEWGELDYLIVDLPPGTGDTQLTMVQTAPLSGAIIVTTPQDVALADARKGFEMFRQVKVPIVGIIENMSSFVCPACGHEEAIFRRDGGRNTAEKHEVPFLGAVPINPAICESGDQGKPFVLTFPDAKESATFREVARRVMEHTPEQASTSS